MNVSLDKQIKLLLLAGIAGLILVGCVEKFMPELKSTNELIVIYGSVVKGDSIQTITVSHSSAIDNPEYRPISDCRISVTHNTGVEFSYTESSPGIYVAEIPEQYLELNSTFQLYVSTPDGNEYQSETETIIESSPIEHLYYKIEEYQSSSETHEKGLQFYVDLKAPEHAASNYMWKMDETWEIHTFFDIDSFFERGDTLDPVLEPISDSINVCWSTQPVNKYFTSSTKTLTVNEKKSIPLSFLASTDPKINVEYSLLVKQYALSDKAYEYHNLNNISSEDTDGLYESQPSQSISNIKNINQENEKILGYFWASSYTEKRIFFKGPLTHINSEHCSQLVPVLPAIGETEAQFLNRQGRDLFFLVAMEYNPKMPDDVILWGYPYNTICIDCTAEGGTTKKPDFWE